MDSMLLLRGVGLASGFALHVAPLVTIREILGARSTLNYHISTYGFSLINQATNLWYAIVREDAALIMHRSMGVIFNSYYVYIFLMYCPPAKLTEFKRTLLRLFLIFVAFAADLHVALPLYGGGAAQYMTHIALFGAITGIGSTAGPLATVGEVLRTRDASSLPLPYLSTVTLQCATWTLYGYLRDDLSTFINNLVGVILGSIQLALIFWYPSKRGAGGGTAGAGGGGGLGLAGIGGKKHGSDDGGVVALSVLGTAHNGSPRDAELGGSSGSGGDVPALDPGTGQVSAVAVVAPVSTGLIGRGASAAGDR